MIASRGVEVESKPEYLAVSVDVARFLFGVTVPFTANMFLRDQLTRLSARNHEVHVVSSPADALGGFQPIQGVIHHEVQMTRQPNFFTDVGSFFSWIRLLGTVRPNVLVVSTPKASALGLVAAMFWRVRVRLYHVRGLRLEGQTGVMRWLGKVMEVLMVRLATIVLCDSESLREQLANIPGVESRKLVVLGRGSACGVDCERFKPAGPLKIAATRRQLGVDVDEVLVGYVGRVTKDKGVALLLKAVRELRSRGLPVRLIVAGPAEDEEFDSTVTPSDRHWLIRRNEIVDPVDFLLALDIFTLPSFREGMPISLLEASASGIAVVTTDATGCRDAIIPDLTGLIAPRGNLEALTSAIAEMSMKADLRRALAEQGRSFVEKEFNHNLVNDRFVTFLESMLNGSHSRNLNEQS